MATDTGLGFQKTHLGSRLDSSRQHQTNTGRGISRENAAYSYLSSTSEGEMDEAYERTVLGLARVDEAMKENCEYTVRFNSTPSRHLMRLGKQRLEDRAARRPVAPDRVPPRRGPRGADRVGQRLGTQGQGQELPEACSPQLARPHCTSVRRPRGIRAPTSSTDPTTCGRPGCC